MPRTARSAASTWMDRHAVAIILEQIADLLDAGSENRFKARAFRNAARAVEKLDDDLRTLVSQRKLQDVRGLGPVTARVIEELVATGESAYYAELKSRAPSGIRELLRVPGLGAGRIGRLHAELGIANLDDLEAAARAGRIAELRGFGARTQQQILEGIAFARGAGGRRRFHQAEEAAARITGYIATLPGIDDAFIAGDLRRRHEIVEAITIIAVTRDVDGDTSRALDAVRGTPGILWTDPAADAVRGRLGDGLPVEVRLARRADLGAALIAGTGSAAHVETLLRTGEAAGVRIDAGRILVHDSPVEARDEHEAYALFGLPYIPVELRETGAEVEAAAQGRLPRLLELDDLRGCFHCHTTYSDGKATVAEMAEAALALGWRYLGIADHSRNAGYAGGLDAAQLRRQRREIDAWNRRRGDELHLFAGIEADILADGQLDFAAQGEGDVLDALDFVIGSAHSGFRTTAAAITTRLVRAAADPRLTMLGHATGRLLLIRDGYPVDLDAVIDAAASAGAIIEINADPHRLDMSWQHWPRARELGVRTSVNPDAHSAGGLRAVRYGVNIARKAWLGPADVLNAWPLDDVRAFLEAKKRRAAKG
jgi:DNA polymerase (family X)